MARLGDALPVTAGNFDPSTATHRQTATEASGRFPAFDAGSQKRSTCGRTTRNAGADPPRRVPNLLINGAAGIAVGMATTPTA